MTTKTRVPAKTKPKPKPASARLAALDALVRIDDGAYAHIVVPAMLGRTRLDDRDRAFVTDLVYGTVRAQRRVDDLLARVVQRSLKRLDAPVRAALRLGAYQLLSDVPAHAAVGETVAAVVARSPRARGFVNANLRALTRLGPPWPVSSDLGVALSYPDWLVERLIDELGADTARDAMAAMNDPASVTLRPNPRLTTADALEAELRDAGVHVERGALVSDSLLVRGIGDPAKLAAVRDGRATPQDQGSQAVVAVLAPLAGDRVGDLAAAPGGKATAIGERVGDEGAVVALDIDAGRVRLVAGAATRLALDHVFPVVGDAESPPFGGRSFDRVLLDAPCSGIGVLRRRPDARWQLREESIAELASLQKRLLAAAAALVRPGGVLVYSVCTMTAEETLAVDDWAMHHLVEFDPLPAPATPWRPHGRGALLLPQDAGTDGMYVLALHRPSAVSV
ncbi:MAG: 16S rRNA (cytosine(967)-C(5))-methyltransferase RsmB [Acidimicrobiia bacterium]